MKKELNFFNILRLFVSEHIDDLFIEEEIFGIFNEVELNNERNAKGSS